MKKIKASVLIANFNNQKYIDECLRSLLNQTYKNFEIIFHDDDSKDDSIINIKKYKNVKIIENKKRGKFGSLNQINAFQRAFKLCKGEFIFLLDSDDYFLKDKIKNIIKVFESNSKIKVIYDLPIILEDKKKMLVKKKSKIIKNYWPYIPPQSCISFRRKYFADIIKKIKVKNFYDVWMDFRLAIYLKYIENNFYIHEQNLTIYRQNANSVSSGFTFLSNNWWKRRKQAHDYVKYFFSKNKMQYFKNLDCLITNFIYFFIKWLKKS